MTGCRREQGFALPLTLFIVAIATIVLSAAMVQVQVDRRIAESAADEVDAVAIAQSGLQVYLANTTFDDCYRVGRPVNGDSARINVTGGYADVVAQVLQRPIPDTLAPWTYAVRSTARVIEPTMGADPQAVRTVAQFAQWHSGRIDVLGAFVAANGLVNSGFACPGGYCGKFHGADETSSSCRQPSPPSLRVGGPLPSLADYVLSGLAPVGGATSAAVAAATNIDWAATIGGGLVPDYDYVRTWDAGYPSMLVQGNATLGAAGATTYGWGLLIVTGDLTILGNSLQWYGVVLVGGKIDFDARSERFDGAVISGLNAQLGLAVPQGQIDGGDYLGFHYNSGYVRRALASLAGFAPIPEAWVENWATF